MAVHSAHEGCVPMSIRGRLNKIFGYWKMFIQDKKKKTVINYRNAFTLLSTFKSHSTPEIFIYTRNLGISFQSPTCIRSSRIKTCFCLFPSNNHERNAIVIFLNNGRGFENHFNYSVQTGF